MCSNNIKRIDLIKKISSAGSRRDGAEGFAAGISPLGGDECKRAAGEPSRRQHAGPREEGRNFNGQGS